MAADGNIPKADVRARLPELDRQKEQAKQELAGVMDRKRQEKELDALESIVFKDPENPYIHIYWPDVDEEDSTGYKKLLQRLGLKAVKYSDGTLELAGDYGPLVSTLCTLPRCTAWATTSLSSTPVRWRKRTCPV
jgi:hypothetical protein